MPTSHSVDPLNIVGEVRQKPVKLSYKEKFSPLVSQTLFSNLPEPQQLYLKTRAMQYQFSLQQLRQLCEIAIDLEMWPTDSIDSLWPDEAQFKQTGKALQKAVVQQLVDNWQRLKASSNHYQTVIPIKKVSAAAKPLQRKKEKLGLGYCPVASPKTRCCNLMTLDAVDNCGYGCSYCSIQSFFDGKEIHFDKDFANKLEQLEIDPDKTYHIGTGQSSDSLMWGNSHGVLEALIQFASKHPNVILELKTKSANIKYLLENDFPRNMLFTWSLNTPAIIANEEHGTVSLEKRLAAARAIADKGGIVGFHFHPMVHYDEWARDYADVIQQLSKQFKPEEVALVSLGTLTFIKPVIKDIRQQGIPGQILKMPLEDAEGKLSYPDEIKLDLFKHAYDCFPQDWKDQVFYYLCMENQRFWEPVFGFTYNTNEAFETAMKQAYTKKILNPSP